MVLLMLKQKLKFITSIKALFWPLVMGAVLLSTTFYAGLARADQYDEQIRTLQQQNAGSQAASNQLASQASSYEDAINKLQAEINALQQAIVDNQNKSNDLQKQIDAKQIELDHQKQVLGENIKTMYVEGQISTLEILASSNNISDFVNKETYRTAMRNQIKTTVDTITQLKVQLQKQQDQLQSMIKDQQSQQAQLNSAQLQQSQMLAYTEGQKATYDQQIKANNSQIGSLKAAQAAANQKLGGAPSAGDPNHGGYPAYLDNAYQDSILDPWGMFNRECVSYTAWKVQQTYGYMPYWGGTGNAIQWPGDAANAGIPTGTTPRAHSVAIWPVGYYGHAMWVEGVSPDGRTIYVSQYNYDWQGHYSEMSISSAGLTYIYFGG